MPLNIDDFLASSAGAVPPEEKDKFGEFLARAGIKPGRSEQMLGELKAAQDADVAEGRLGGAERGFRRMAELITGRQNQQPLEKPQNVSRLLQRVGVEQQLTQPENALRMEFLREMARGADAQQAYARALEKEKQARLYKEQDEQSRREWEEQKMGKQQEFQAEQNRLGREATAGREAGKEKKEASQAATDLRNQLHGQQVYKETQMVATAYNKIQSTSNTGAGDISLVYGYMKMVDPGSSVKENEFATADNAGGVPDKIRTLYNKAKSGERLSPEVRRQFKNESRNILDAQLARYNTLADQYKRLATKAGVDPEDVVLPLGIPEHKKEESQVNQLPRQQGTDGKWYVFRGGAWEAE